jgi:hypothetical protein
LGWACAWHAHISAKPSASGQTSAAAPHQSSRWHATALSPRSFPVPGGKNLTAKTGGDATGVRLSGLEQGNFYVFQVGAGTVVAGSGPKPPGTAALCGQGQPAAPTRDRRPRLLRRVCPTRAGDRLQQQGLQPRARDRLPARAPQRRGAPRRARRHLRAACRPRRRVHELESPGKRHHRLLPDWVGGHRGWRAGACLGNPGRSGEDPCAWCAQALRRWSGSKTTPPPPPPPSPRSITEIGPDGNPASATNVLPNKNSTAIIRDLTPGGTYKVRVAACWLAPANGLASLERRPLSSAPPPLHARAPPRLTVPPHSARV